MNHSEISSALRRAPLFEALDDGELMSIAERAQLEEYSEGDWVFRQHDHSRDMFIVVDGRYRVVVGREDGGLDREVGEVGPGDHFGEVAMLEEGERGASVQAASAGRLIKLPREELIAAVTRTPELGLDLCRGYVRLLQASRDAFLTIPFVEVPESEDIVKHSKLLSPRISLACQALVLERTGERVVVGMVDPYDKLAREFVREVLGSYRVEVAGISRTAFARATEAIVKPTHAKAAVEALERELVYLDREGQPVDFGSGEEATILRETFAQAVSAGASDIHFEPTSTLNQIRLRLDGSMFTVRERIPSKMFQRLIARLKAMSELDTTNSRLPEDGRFLLLVGGDQVEVRIATAPCLGGQKAVLRLVDARRKTHELGALFASRDVEQLCHDVLMNPSGLALVVGPAGSGKTTTLYAALNALWEATRTLNVVTIEDPIEYELPFATQMQVNPGFALNFETLLRSTLRQNPDVILVGEIRDAESAAIATEAAGTGHLVLSSLHTDSAIDAVVRLRRLGVPPYLLASCLRGVVSQRLLPMVCPDCAEVLGSGENSVVLAQRLGLLEEGFTGQLQRGAGCDACRSTGESGRTGVFEMLAVDDALRTLIEDDAGANRLREGITGEHFLSLERYAGMLLEKGVVSPERALSLFPKIMRRRGG